MASDGLALCDPVHYEGQDLEALADLPHYYRWILKTFHPYLRGRVLEVGAGTGNFAAHYVDAVREAVLLEPARNLFPSLSARFSNRAHVHPLCALLNDFCDPMERWRGGESSAFDAAVLVNVLEHVEDDRAMLRRLGDLLRPGGALLVFVPALRWLYGSLDQVVHHYRRYTHSSLRRLVSRSGLHLVELHYFDVFGILPWLLTGRLLRQRRFSPGAARIYDRLVVPLGARIERWINLPLGKNLICVARKPDMVSLPAISHAPKAA